MTLAPIILFAYKRPHELQQTLQALQANYLASESELYVFADGPRRPVDEPKVAATRAVLDQITGFKAVHRFYSPHNIGCADSIIAGISSVLKLHPAAIVVEDDIISSPNFLDFMNQSLQQYESNKAVFSIGGYTFPLRKPAGYTDDVYFFGRTCAWGWAIWADRWFKADWELTDFDAFINDTDAKNRFNEGGSDRVRMLQRAYTKDIDAWDIRLCYAEFRQQGVTVFPTLSKTLNIGVDSPDSTTEVVYDRYRTPLDTGEQRTFRLPEQVNVNESYARQFRHKFSPPVRIWNKLRTYAKQFSSR
jgi:GR25 family glycosyltransferase involved in LPS biosynthesis